MSQVCQATYSNVPVWVLNTNGVSVMRRQLDGWVNATHLLKVANYDKPRRTRVLERDVQTGEHEKIQGGYGKYQGTWVPLDRARILAKEFKVYDEVQLLLDYEDKGDGTTLPEAERIPTRRAPALPKDLPAKRARKAVSMPAAAAAAAAAAPIEEYGTSRRGRPPKSQSFVAPSMPAPHAQASVSVNQPQMLGSAIQTSGSMAQGTSPASSPMSSTSGFLSDEDMMGSSFQWEGMGSPTSRYNNNGMRADQVRAGNAYLNQYSATLLNFFMAPNQNKIPDILLHPNPDFNVNQVIDDEGHTPFHWAAAMGLVKVMEALLDIGADPTALNYAGHTPLARAVHFTNNYDIRSFPQVLELLKDTVFYIDSQSASVLHHIASATSSRSKAPSARYYMELILATMTKMHHIDYVHQIISQMDVNQDTALHIAARNGSRKLVKLLLSYDAPADIANRSGRTAREYIVEYETQRKNPQLLNSSSPPSMYIRRPMPSTPLGRHQPNPHVSEAAISATQQVAGRMADYLEELAQTYDSDLKDRDGDIEQVRRRLYEVKKEITEVQNLIPQLQAQLGPEDQVGLEIQHANEIISQRSHDLRLVLERTQARDLAVTVQKEEADVQEVLKQELTYGQWDLQTSRILTHELRQLQANRQALVNEIVELYATAGTGERMNDYRKLIALSCGANINDVDELLDGIAQALEDKQ